MEEKWLRSLDRTCGAIVVKYPGVNQAIESLVALFGLKVFAVGYLDQLLGSAHVMPCNTGQQTKSVRVPGSNAGRVISVLVQQ
jgi:hypothetical protein